MKTTNSEWMSISDMMSGLMLVFMFIAISFMIQVQTIAESYGQSKEELNIDLKKEFGKDMVKWGAYIEKDNTIVFDGLKVQFSRNSYDIPKTFEEILSDFFPRYIKILTLAKYKSKIEEIRIEGHTSKEYNVENYLYNMALSQNRANAVLAYCYNIDEQNIKNHKKWLEKNLRANGMAYSHLKFNDNHIQDTTKSRRVEFKVKLNAEEHIRKTLESIKSF